MAAAAISRNPFGALSAHRYFVGVLSDLLASRRRSSFTAASFNPAWNFVPAGCFGRGLHHEQVQAYAFLLRAGGNLRVHGFRHAHAECATVPVRWRNR